MKFDKTKPFGRITPPDNGAWFEQRGFCYDHNHQLIESLLTDDNKADMLKREAQAEKDREASAKAKEKAMQADEGKQDALDEASGHKATPAPEPTEAAVHADKAKVKVGEEVIDLRAWALTGKKYSFPKVVRAAEIIGISAQKKDDLIVELVSNAIITQAEFDAAVDSGIRW